MPNALFGTLYLLRYYLKHHTQLRCDATAFLLLVANLVSGLQNEINAAALLNNQVLVKRHF